MIKREQYTVTFLCLSRMLCKTLLRNFITTIGEIPAHPVDPCVCIDLIFTLVSKAVFSNIITETKMHGLSCRKRYNMYFKPMEKDAYWVEYVYRMKH